MTDATVRDRYRRVAARFTETVAGVPAEGWERPAPCEGWVARDVVRHLAEWVPGFFGGTAAPPVPTPPSVDVDPAAAWASIDGWIQGALDDPAVAETTIVHPMAGTHSLADAIATFVLPDVLVHTWDLARATGQDESLDVDEVAGIFAGMEPMDEVLRQSGQFGARVAVSDDADVQTKLIAFTGRQP